MLSPRWTIAAAAALCLAATAAEAGWKGHRAGHGGHLRGHDVRQAHGHVGAPWAHRWRGGGRHHAKAHAIWAPSFYYRTAAVAIAPAPREPEIAWRLPTLADLPTRADLAQASGFHPAPPAAPELYVIEDETHGRSGKAGGARVYATARVAELGDGFAAGSSGAARIITLKAR